MCSFLLYFVCTGNTCRSPMAMVIARRRLQELSEEIEILSAGISAVKGQAASAHAQFIANQEGLELREHLAQGIGKKEVESADLVLTMTRSHCEYLRSTFFEYEGKIFSLAEFAGMGNQDVEDPFGASLELYEKSFQQLDSWIEVAEPALRLLLETKRNRGQE